MPDSISSAIDARRSAGRIVIIGISAIVAILLAAAVFLYITLPDGNLFNERVSDLFTKYDDLKNGAETKLLEILVQSGEAFSETAESYRIVIFVMLVFAAAMLIAALVLLVFLVVLSRRLAQIERAGIEVNSLVISREEKTVYMNDIGLKLTDAAMEALSVLAEARMDDDVLSGSEIEAMVSGRATADCDEAAGATRIKRLRDAMGNQLVSELLVKNIARKGYILSIDKDVIQMD